MPLSDMEQFLHQIASLMEESRQKPEGWKWGSYERLILGDGTHWTEGRIEKNGEPRDCFQNSFLLAVNGPYEYVEGYAMSTLGLPVMHAWCLDGDQVVETTWPEFGLEYRGIVMPTMDAFAVMRVTEVYGVIPNEWMVKHPLLRLGRLDREELDELIQLKYEEEE